MWNVLYHSNDIRDCLTITRYNFTSDSIWNTHILDRWRERSEWITNIMIIVYSTSLVFFTGSSLMFRDNILTIKNHDGSVGIYHQNLVNLYFLVTDKTYNAHYETFYFIESLYTTCLIILFLVFDILLVTMCLAGLPCPARCKWLTSRSNLSEINRFATLIPKLLVSIKWTFGYVSITSKYILFKSINVYDITIHTVL